MKIEVRNINLMFLYRMFRIFGCNFYTNDDKYINIVKALNIKSKKERLEYVYDEAIKYINEYYSDDLCQFKNQQCIAQRKQGGKEINGCCKKCSLVTNIGCPSVNLSCKLIYCKTALKNLKKLRFSEIPILRCLTLTQRIILKSSFFNTRENILMDMHKGLIYSVLRSLKMSIFFSKTK